MATETARDALTAAIERADDALRKAQGSIDEAHDALYDLKKLIGLTDADLDAPNPTRERAMLAEWNRISGRTEAKA